MQRYSKNFINMKLFKGKFRKKRIEQLESENYRSEPKLVELSEKEKADLLEEFIHSQEYDFREYLSYSSYPIYFGLDSLFEDAAKLVVKKQQGSIALIQRTFSIGYNRAGRIIEQFEKFDIVGPFNEEGSREVFVKSESELTAKFNEIAQRKKIVSDFFIEHFNEIEIEREKIEKKIVAENELNEKESLKKQILDNERRKKLYNAAKKELIESGKLYAEKKESGSKRESIPQDVMDKVWNRDGGKCVKCGSRENLEFDHIIPFSKGGATTYRNLQLLCKKCNLEKSNKIG